MIASGKTVKEIDGEVFLSVKTINTYRSRILEKNENEKQCGIDSLWHKK